MNAIITLTTDFGRKDAYAGAMKGVILSVNPSARIIDLSHDIQPQNIREGAFVLASAFRFFPKGTIHVAVVDPGVGSCRKLICVKTPSAYFMAPDNGILTPVFDTGKSFMTREISNRVFFRKEISSTFHGRDIFASSAAWLSKKNIFTRLGPVLKDVRRISWPQPRVVRGRIIGEVLSVDHFGNLITNIKISHLGKGRPRFAQAAIRGLSRSGLASGRPAVQVGKTGVWKWGQCYADGKPGQLMALLNSVDHLEIAVPNGSAAALTGAKIGMEVIVR